MRKVFVVQVKEEEVLDVGEMLRNAIKMDGDEDASVCEDCDEKATCEKYQAKPYVNPFFKIMANGFREEVKFGANPFQEVTDRILNDALKKYQAKHDVPPQKVAVDLNDFSHLREMEAIDALQNIAISMGEVNTDAVKLLQEKYGYNFSNLKYRDKLKAAKYLVEKLEQFSMK